MVDTSRRIIILSAVVLVIILWFPNSGLMRNIVTIDDLEVEIVTSRDNYTLGENFTANVYLVNTRSRDVWMEPINAVMFSGQSVSDNRDWPIAVIDFMNDTLHIPSKSKVFLVYRRFTPTIAGEFEIRCGGVRKTVQIYEPLKIGQGVGFQIDDWLDPEYALSRGIKGYVNVSYVSEMPARIIVSPGKIINYTIRLELIPHVPEFTETEVVLDPEDLSEIGMWIGGSYPLINDYVRYSPNGTILLKVDEPLNVTMILSFPEGFTGMSHDSRRFLGVGIKAGVPVLDWITSDDG